MSHKPHSCLDINKNNKNKNYEIIYYNRQTLYYSFRRVKDKRCGYINKFLWVQLKEKKKSRKYNGKKKEFARL